MKMKVLCVIVFCVLIISGFGNPFVNAADIQKINLNSVDESYAIENDFNDASIWDLTGDVYINENLGKLCLTHGNKSGNANYIGSTYDPGTIYKIKVECSGFNIGASPQISVLLSANGVSFTQVIQNIKFGRYNRSETWDIPKSKQGSDLKIKILMSAVLALTMNMDWIKVTYWCITDDEPIIINEGSQGSHKGIWSEDVYAQGFIPGNYGPCGFDTITKWGVQLSYEFETSLGPVHLDIYESDENGNPGYPDIEKRVNEFSFTVDNSEIEETMEWFDCDCSAKPLSGLKMNKKYFIVVSPDSYNGCCAYWHYSNNNPDIGESYPYHYNVVKDCWQEQSGYDFGFRIFGECNGNPLEVQIDEDEYNTFLNKQIRFICSISGGCSPFYYRWDFDDSDGIQIDSTKENPIWGGYDEEKDCNVTLIVLDSNGETDTDTAIVHVQGEEGYPVADAGGLYTGTLYNDICTITFDCSRSYDTNTDGSIVKYRWDIDGIEGWDTGWRYFSNPTLDFTYIEQKEFDVTLEVMDDDGLTDKDSAKVTINKAPPDQAKIIWVKTYLKDGSELSYDEGFILQSLPLKNEYWALAVNANKVTFELGGDYQTLTETDENPENGQFRVTFDYSKLPPFSAFENFKLKVTAYGDKGNDERVYHPKVIPMIGCEWFYNYMNYVIKHCNLSNYVNLSLGPKTEYDDNNDWQFTTRVDLSKEKVGGQPDGKSPVDAGGNAKVKDVGGKYKYSGGIGSSISLCSDGSIVVTGGFDAGVDAKSVAVSITAELAGNIIVDFDKQSIEWVKVTLTVNGEIKIPVFLIGKKVCGVGVQAGIDITPGVEITFVLEPVNEVNGGIIPGLGIKVRELTSCKLSCTVDAYAEAGFVIGDFRASAGGKVGVLLANKPKDNYFEKLQFDCWIRGRIRFLFWTWKGEWRYYWEWDPNSEKEGDYSEVDWHQLNRDYMNQANYENFKWETVPSIGETAIHALQDKFPDAKPDIAQYGPNKIMMVFNHDPFSSEDVSGMTICYATWENGVLSKPKPIPCTFNDGKLQMDPQIAFDNKGNGFCIWTQTPRYWYNSALDTWIRLTDFTEGSLYSHVAGCVWDKKNKTWSSSIINITSPGEMHCNNPALAGNANGDIVVVWNTDEDRDHRTLGDGSIYARFWNGNTQSFIPSDGYYTIVEDEPFISKPSVAILEPGHAICTFIMDTDNNATTFNDHEVYYSMIPATTGPTRLYSKGDSYRDAFPSVTYAQDESAYIVWNKFIPHSFTDEYGREHVQYNGDLYCMRTDHSEHYSKSPESLAFNQPNKLNICDGTISNPSVFSLTGYGAYNYKPTSFVEDMNFAIGWNAKTSSKLGVSKITKNGDVINSKIYNTDSRLSQTRWCMTNTDVVAITVERPVPVTSDDMSSGKNCDITFVRAPGLDIDAPSTICKIAETKIGEDAQGHPIYQHQATLTLDANDDEFGSGVEITRYKLDDGPWKNYEVNEEIVVDIKGGHTIYYNSSDYADNDEEEKDFIFQVIGNRRPNRPAPIHGPSKGSVNVEHKFTASATDPDGDQLYYQWNWDESTPDEDWYGPFNSGKEVEVNHSWSEQNEYHVSYRVRDIHSNVSNWAQYVPIQIVKSRSTSQSHSLVFIKQLLGRFPVFMRVFKHLSTLIINNEDEFEHLQNLVSGEPVVEPDCLPGLDDTVENPTLSMNIVKTDESRQFQNFLSYLSKHILVSKGGKNSIK